MELKTAENNNPNNSLSNRSGTPVDTPVVYSIDTTPAKIVSEFQFLMDKSQQLFAGLRLFF